MAGFCVKTEVSYEVLDFIDFLKGAVSPNIALVTDFPPEDLMKEIGIYTYDSLI